MKKCGVLLILSALLISLWASADAASLEHLPMDSTAIAPPPRDECFLSDWEYQDESIHVIISEGEAQVPSDESRAPVHYTCAYIKIAHPSQLRAVPAAQVNSPSAEFFSFSSGGAKCGRIARAANAVVGINGDFYSNADKCQVVLRQSRQVRNMGSGMFDVLVVDHNGDFDAIPQCTKRDYIAYYEGHENGLYQAFCFGPVLVRDGRSVIDENFYNGYMISGYLTQRVAICQLGELEYMLITCDGDAQFYTFGMTVMEFAQLCESIGKSVSPEGFRLAYNLDGGNSASLVFKRRNEKGELEYQKLNMPERERDLADMICFVSLVK